MKSINQNLNELDVIGFVSTMLNFKAISNEKDSQNIQSRELGYVKSQKKIIEEKQSTNRLIEKTIEAENSTIPRYIKFIKSITTAVESTSTQLVINADLVDAEETINEESIDDEIINGAAAHFFRDMIESNDISSLEESLKPLKEEFESLDEAFSILIKVINFIKKNKTESANIFSQTKQALNSENTPENILAEAIFTQILEQKFIVDESEQTQGSQDKKPNYQIISDAALAKQIAEEEQEAINRINSQQVSYKKVTKAFKEEEEQKTPEQLAFYEERNKKILAEEKILKALKDAAQKNNINESNLLNKDIGQIIKFLVPPRGENFTERQEEERKKGKKIIIQAAQKLSKNKESEAFKTLKDLALENGLDLAPSSSIKKPSSKQLDNNSKAQGKS
ncbi:MAG: hypothetical protein SFV53_00375 [Rickettsiales bacterium]|nr:hypothetical protein [Rickettsiales bacterium]